MSEKNKENNENGGNFKTVKKSNYQSYDKKISPKKSNFSFGKNVLLPFVSGVVGCALVLGVCLYVPEVKSKVFGSTSTSKSSVVETINNSEPSTGYVDQASLSNYSDTSIYAANKILPSIVGISVEYSVSAGRRTFAFCNATNFNRNCHRFRNNN